MKTRRDFHFTDLTYSEMAELVNKEYPISIKKLEKIINRIYLRYPIVDKADISIIVKSTFESMRELLINGDVINLHDFACNIKFLFYKRFFLNKNCANLRIFMKTSAVRMRKDDK